MFSIAAFTALIAAVAAAPHSTPLIARQNKGTYVSYNGDGSAGQGWPTSDKWVSSFDSMWGDNLPLILVGCGAFGGVPNTSQDEANQMKDAIQTVSKSSGVDPRVILAAIMQESNGCVRVWGTANGVTNPGLMQDHNGKHSCNDGAGVVGNILNPCPQEQILGMIQDGVMGTVNDHNPKGDGGAGYKDLGADSTDSQKVYEAARKYNAGSLSGSDLAAPGATASYCSDMANRLMGVVFSVTSFVHGSPGTGSPSAAAAAPSAPAAAASSAPAAAAPSAPAAAAGSCKTPYTVKAGDTCWAIGSANGLSLDAFQKLNPSVACASIKPGASVCIA